MFYIRRNGPRPPALFGYCALRGLGMFYSREFVRLQQSFKFRFVIPAKAGIQVDVQRPNGLGPQNRVFDGIARSRMAQGQPLGIGFPAMQCHEQGRICRLAYLIRNVIASEAWRSRFSTGAEKRDCFVAFAPRNDNQISLSPI